MDPSTIALIVSTLAQLLSGGPGETSIGAATPPGAQPNPNAGFQAPTPGADTGVSSIVPDTGAADQLAQQFAGLSAAAPAVAPLVPAPAGGVGPPQAPPQAIPEIQGPPAPAAIPETPAGIGEILAANPEALMMVAQFLGLGQGDEAPARAAPIPGGTQGSIIPGLQLPQSGQIGALLRQIPGLG